MKKKENITDIFMVYFLGKLYSGTYRKLYNSLRDIESIENLTGGNYKFDSNDREIKDFVEKFYDFKRSVEERYRDSLNNANSIEEQIRPLRIKIIHKIDHKKIIRLYSNCVEFEKIMNKRYDICMAKIDDEIQQDKNKETCAEL